MTVRALGAVAFLAALATPASARALAPASVSATVRADETRVSVGDVFTVEFQVARTGSGQVPPPKLPESLGTTFKLGQCSTSNSRSSNFFGGGGRSTTARTVTCPLEAKTAGKHKIAFTTKAGNKTLTSNSITITVLEAGEAATVEDPTVEAPTEAQGDVFVWVSTDKRRAYVGEQITFRLDVYENRRLLDVSLKTTPTFEGFSAEELPTPEMYTTAVQEIPYRVRPGIRRALFPQRAGTLTIGASELLVGRRARRKSPPLDIDVLPLPTQGRPADFSANNVGSYQISAAVDRDEVQPGEPFTLTYTISGEGNIDLLEPGVWASLPGVRRYDPKITTERSGGAVVGGKRRYAFLMIPERPGRLTIPAHDLAFFDPQAEAYATASSKAVEVLVGGDPNAAPVAADAPEVTEAPIEEPLAPLMSVVTVPRGTPRELWLTPRRWTWGMVGVPFLALFGLGAGAAWRRLGPDEATVIKARTRARRREQIDSARAAATSGDGFHTAIATLLQDTALDRTGPSGVGLPRPELVALLARHGVGTDERNALASLLDRCDAARFGAQAGEASERAALLEEALDVVVRISRDTGSA